MLRRKVYDNLLEWKSRKHKPLVISGQRQVGKTFIIRELARNEYQSSLEINLAQNRTAHDIFKGDLDVDSLIRRIGLAFPDVEMIPGHTLIILDEIQECIDAYSSLKSFSEDGRFDVIASGSMLGVRVPNIADSPDKQDVLVPLGYEECITMYSLDFEEFLWAKGVSQDIIDNMKGCIRRCERMDDFILERMCSYFREFMIVGGMPEAVASFIDTGQFTGVKTIHGELNDGCIRDITRYSSRADITKTMECYESIPDQLAESNKKYMYSRIRDQRSRKAADTYMENLLWIKGAGYGNFCYAAKDLTPPLRSHRDSFKVYQSDTGMLVGRYGDNCIKAIYSGDMGYNLGAITENVVAEGLMKCGYMPRYFSVNKGEKMMELDFVVETGDGVCVIEVKSGKGRSAPSIGKVPRFYNVARRICLAEENIYVDDQGIEHYPLFASFFFGEFDPEWDGPAL